jgi:hypothetical protein
MKFSEKISSSRSSNIFLFNTIEPVTGLETYVFFKVKNEKLELFKKFRKGDQCKLSQYGEVIKFGFDTSPPQQVIDEINAKYGTDF